MCPRSIKWTKMPKIVCTSFFPVGFRILKGISTRSYNLSPEENLFWRRLLSPYRPQTVYEDPLMPHTDTADVPSLPDVCRSLTDAASTHLYSHIRCSSSFRSELSTTCSLNPSSPIPWSENAVTPFFHALTLYSISSVQCLRILTTILNLFTDIFYFFY